MIPPLDPFALTFDSIEIDPARAPSQAAIEQALAMFAPPSDAEAPGFYLLDDAGGRFVIDREFGVVSLRNEAILDLERDAVHVARVQVIEQSGDSYTVDLRLRLDGPVPQVVGAEDFVQGANPAATPPAPTRAPPPRVQWSAYAAASASAAAPTPVAPEPELFGATLAHALPAYAGHRADLRCAAAPPPAHAAAIWSH